MAESDPDAVQRGDEGLRRLLWLLVALDVVWIALYLGVTFFGAQDSSLFRALDLNGEGNVPAWYSSAQLLAIGLVFLILAAKPFASDSRLQPIRWLLLVAAAGFTFLSADEAGQIHENISGLFRPGAEGQIPDTQGIWVYAYPLAAIIVLILVRRPLATAWRTWRRESILVAVGAALIVLGGVVGDTIGFALHSMPVALALETAAEELLELLGESLILLAAGGMLLSSIWALRGAPTGSVG